MSALVLRADARTLPIPDASIDLIVTSPPYFGQRAYSDGGEHYDGQIGSEPTPQEFLTALWEVTAECWRVLKPEGSMFVNLGDKRSGSGAPGTTSGLNPRVSRVQGQRSGLRSYTKAAFGRAKSKQLLPHRYAIGCEDGLADPEGIGWIVRSDLVWSKPNGLPESVRDRCRDSHEYWFHLCKQGDYYASIDEIREPHSGNTHARRKDGTIGPKQERTIDAGHRRDGGFFSETTFNPLGKLPSSVWTIGTEALNVPDHLGLDHFAAFPSEWPRRLILGWSPNGICTGCGQGRVPVVDVQLDEYRTGGSSGRPKKQSIDRERPHDLDNGFNAPGYPQGSSRATITGYSCACDVPIAPTRPAVVLDPFGGTGTTAMVARALGRTGISVDLSNDYCRLARWRIFESGGGAKIESRTNADRQGVLL